MTNPWDQIAKQRHDQLEAGDDDTFNELLLPQLNKILQGINNLSAFKVLDVGCGTGFLTEILSHEVNKIIGIDSSQESISKAREYTKGIKKAKVECISVEKFAEKNLGKFDLAIAHMTLQAIEHLEDAISNVSIVLKTNGWFIFSIPHPCFWSAIKNTIGNDDFQYHIPSTHTNIFRFGDNLQFEVPYFHRSLEVYSSTLRRNGLSIMDIFEPFPNEALMNKYRRPWFSPGFIFILSRKM